MVELLCGLLSIILLILIIVNSTNGKKKRKELEEKLQEELSLEKEKALADVKRQLSILNDEIDRKQKSISYLEETKQRALANEEQIIKKEIENFRLKKGEEFREIQKQYDDKLQKLEMIFDKEKDAVVEEFLQYKELINEKMEEYKKEQQTKIEEIISQERLKIDDIILELENYRQKRETVNQAILREKEIQEKENFYKINITEDDINDMQIIRTIQDKIKNREAINKLIYEVYIKKPVTEMIKRVLNGGAPSGIYKITYIPTGESYIGKSTNVAKRFTEHIKTTFGLGSIAHSSLHTKMARDGVWNFTFELIEEIEKEKLSEREKYWINFYDTKKFGLNEKEGG